MSESRIFLEDDALPLEIPVQRDLQTPNEKQRRLTDQSEEALDRALKTIMANKKERDTIADAQIVTRSHEAIVSSRKLLKNHDPK